MRPVEAWTPDQAVRLDGEDRVRAVPAGLSALAQAAARCNNARLRPDGQESGDPTEVALLHAAQSLGADVDADRRE